MGTIRLEATAATEATATAEASAATKAAATGTTEATATVTTLLALTIAVLLRLEHLQQLLRGENAREFGAILLLDIQTKLRLLDLLLLTGEHFLQFGCSLSLRQFLLLALVVSFAVGLLTQGGEFRLILRIDRSELSLLLVGEFQVLDETFCHARHHLLTTSIAIVIILCVCVVCVAESH